MKRLGIAAESDADCERVTGLADRVVLESVDWIEAEHLDAYRTWCGIGDEAWLDLHVAFERARSQRLPVYGHFGGEPGALDAQMFRCVFLLFADDSTCPDLIVVARDTDGFVERTAGLVQALEDRDWPFEVVSALADPETEAWRLAASFPASPAEESALRAVRTRLGFDPISHAERLTSKKQTDKKDAKRVLQEVCAAGRSADERWDQAELHRMRENGARSGLASFLEEIESKLIPLLGGPPRGSNDS